jgi:hypothetical protein
MDLMVSMKGKGADKIEFKMEKNRYKPCKEWEAKKIFEKDMSGKDVFSLERTGSPDGLKERQEMMISIIENNPDYGQSELYEAYVRLGGKKIDATGILKILDESEVTEIVSDSIGGKGKKKIRRLTETYLSQEMNQSVAESVKKLLNNGHK